MDPFLSVIILLVLRTNSDIAEGQQSIPAYTGIMREQDGQDVFRNPNRQCKSNFCAKFNSRRVFAHCASPGCCLCRCNHGTPTYVAFMHACMKRADIYNLLPVNNSGFQYRVDIRKTRPHCHSTSLSLIDLSARGSTKLYNCQSNKPTLATDLASVVSRCHVYANDSWYYTAGGWRPLLRTNDSVFTAELHLEKNTNKKFINFKWQHDTAQKYSGLIIFIQITCFNTSNVSSPRKAGFVFKTGGGKSINTPTTKPLYLSTHPATQKTHNPVTTGKVHTSRDRPQKTTLPPTSSSELHTLVSHSSNPTSKRGLETTKDTTGVNKGMGRETEGKNKKMGEKDYVIIVAATATGLIFGLIAGILVTIILRKRSDSSNREQVPRRNSEANPTYDRGPGKSIIFNFPEDRKPEDKNDTYQPLVQNTRIKDEVRGQPLYQRLNVACGVLNKTSGEYQGIDNKPMINLVRKHRKQLEATENGPDA